MSHAHHEQLPGYDPGNLLHDGCPECEARAADMLHGLLHLDHNRVRQAWADMLAEKWSGGHGISRRVSVCDWKILNALYSIAVLLERGAGLDPHTILAAIVDRNAELEARRRELFG